MTAREPMSEERLAEIREQGKRTIDRARDDLLTEVERLTEQVERDRASLVRLAQSWARRGKGALAAELLTEFEMDEDEVLGAVAE